MNKKILHFQILIIVLTLNLKYIFVEYKSYFPIMILINKLIGTVDLWVYT